MLWVYAYIYMHLLCSGLTLSSSPKCLYIRHLTSKEGQPQQSGLFFIQRSLCNSYCMLLRIVWQ